MYEKLLEYILKYPKITLYKHLNSDGDCVFSVLGFKQFILDNFPDKEVHIVGSGYFDLIEYREYTSDEFIKGSLGIVLDTSNIERVDDDRTSLCDAVIKIDHHPPVTQFGDFQIVKSTAAATCELLAEIFFSDAFSKYEVSHQTRVFLYCGILTDSMNFTTTSTTANTLKYASMLAADDIKVAELSEYTFKKHLNEFNKVTKLRSYLKNTEKCGYILLDEKDLSDLAMTTKECKDGVAEFKEIEELKVWAIIAYNPETGLYDGSLRSKLGYQVNETAMKFGGGGHVNASGIKGLTRDQAEKLIEELIETSKSHS